ncbi:hypothetical protein VTK26DRAFT_5663 [Humicola hyalothermophila]
MTVLNQAIVALARVAVRQAAETALSSISPTDALFPTIPPSDPTPTISNPAVTPSPTGGTPSSPVPSPTDTSTLANGGAGSGGDGGGSSNNSSSLLFFVALGFGVVFTNLWIIVGVKYCFRYNARNRQLRAEDGEPINMENVPRPHRRRREKKLMPIDEVNEKFPMLKYKTWVASRAREGLPTRGGVSAPPSRPGTIRNADGIVPELAPKERTPTEDRPTASAASTENNPVAETTAAAAVTPSDADHEKPAGQESQSPQHAPKESTSSTVAAAPRTSADADRDPETTVAQKHLSQVSHDEDCDDDDHIDAALPPECMGTSGDTCAICIDTLEDDDDVRGLTCGHAFHAVCIDPWLTTRRACCPLCKADYYTPKPRPQPADGGDGTTGTITVTLPGDSRGHNRMNMPNRPRHAFFSLRQSDRRHRTYYSSSGRWRPTGGSQPRDGGLTAFWELPRLRRGNAESAPSSPSTRRQGFGLATLLARSRAMLPGRGNGPTQRQNHDAVASGANPDATTPSQLEAGTRAT